jgi:hypothetical protein
VSAAAPRPAITEHGLEPVPSLPWHLPKGETLLWQGRPGWRSLARGALHVRAIAAYFVLLAFRAAGAVAGRGEPTAAATSCCASRAASASPG